MKTATTCDSTIRKNRAYLLRLWRVETPDPVWHASLVDSRTGQRIGFATLEELFAYLMEQAECDAQGATMA